MSKGVQRRRVHERARKNAPGSRPADADLRTGRGIRERVRREFPRHAASYVILRSSSGAAGEASQAVRDARLESEKNPGYGVALGLGGGPRQVCS